MFDARSRPKGVGVETVKRVLNERGINPEPGDPGILEILYLGRVQYSSLLWPTQNNSV